MRRRLDDRLSWQWRGGILGAALLIIVLSVVQASFQALPLGAFIFLLLLTLIGYGAGQTLYIITAGRLVEEGGVFDRSIYWTGNFATFAMYLSSVGLFGYNLRLAVLMLFVLALPLILTYGLVLLLLLINYVARIETRRRTSVVRSETILRFPPPQAVQDINLPKLPTGEVDLDELIRRT